MKRIQLMFAYHEFLKGGKYFTAHKILELLNKKKVYLGLDDTSWEVEQLAYKVMYSHHFRYRLEVGASCSIQLLL